MADQSVQIRVACRSGVTNWSLGIGGSVRPLILSSHMFVNKLSVGGKLYYSKYCRIILGSGGGGVVEFNYAGNSVRSTFTNPSPSGGAEVSLLTTSYQTWTDYRGDTTSEFEFVGSLPAQCRGQSKVKRCNRWRS
jgi:hypothetical protein